MAKNTSHTLRFMESFDQSLRWWGANADMFLYLNDALISSVIHGYVFMPLILVKDFNVSFKPYDS